MRSRSAPFLVSMIGSLTGALAPAYANTTFPDAYVTFAVAMPKTDLPAFKASVIADPRYAESNCDGAAATLADVKGRKFLPDQYRRDHSRAWIAKNYGVFVVACSNSVTTGIFTLLGEKSMEYTKTHPSTPIRITSYVASNPSLPSGCFPRNCNGTLMKTQDKPCSPLC